jgi:hypothetical protein
MDDHDSQGSRSALLRARMRGAIDEARRQGAASLRSVRRSAAEAAERLKHTETAERLGAEVETRRLIKKAADAQRRGNHAMAYRLLQPEVREHPDDARLVTAFWNAALACERPGDAAPAMLRVIRKLASGGKPERAVELWQELHRAVPTALVEPGALVRMVPIMRANRATDQVRAALREAVDPRNNGLTPGLAGRVAEMARELDPRVALCAAHRAVASPDLDDTKRARLERLVDELERAEAAVAASVPIETPSEEGGEEEGEAPAALQAPAPAAHFVDIDLTEAMPTRLLEDGVGLQLQGARKVRIKYGDIKALAVAEVWGVSLHPIVIVDLVLNWGNPKDPAVRVVRLRSDGFDPRMVLETPTDDDEALRSFITEILTRSDAIPLPNRDSVLSLKLRAFDDFAAYERDVLQVMS